MSGISKSKKAGIPQSYVVLGSKARIRCGSESGLVSGGRPTFKPERRQCGDGYAWVATTGILEKIAGGKATLGSVGGTDYPALFASVPGEIAGIVTGIAFVVIAALLPSRLIGLQS